MYRHDFSKRNGVVELLEQGIAAYYSRKYVEAQFLCFVAGVLFDDLGETFDANIARDWANTASRRRLGEQKFISV